MQIRSEQHPLDDPTVESYVIPGAKVFDRYFTVPLDHDQPNSHSTIQIFVRHLVPITKQDQQKTLPFLIYLQGGPGFEVTMPSNATSGWIKVAFDQGYQVLLLDQRGTGLSSAISALSLAHLDSDQAKAEYLTHFRADSIVKDCEWIRKTLTKDRLVSHESRISLLGQSFGGFSIVTYLSLFPESIHKAYITGGVPPLVDHPDPVYRALYPRMLKKNKLYYQKFPQDVAHVRQIVSHLSSNTVPLPNGGVLTPRRFLQLGLMFGMSGGYDSLHETVTLCVNDLKLHKSLTYRTLNHIQHSQSFDTNVLYCILHEAIYCQNHQASRWAADRVLNDEFAEEFEWRIDKLRDNQPIHFTGETVYPFMLEDYAELRPLANVAHLLAEHPWSQLYDVSVLNGLDTASMELAGVSYFDDMYVDRDLSERTAQEITGFKQWFTNEYAHK
ncbi:alpha/beta-hydrolase [Hesseltinella vesiculosa]|uniref:Alpha/beta-hydrolase n=1 Tax=Hesseltinella vesiculosa TaxID=101127 RepID=A0A1X2G6Y6_9FUNG|nr:alpha/beta-hydrolase [Hesseltinella vesiculosa]